MGVFASRKQEDTENCTFVCKNTRLLNTEQTKHICKKKNVWALKCSWICAPVMPSHAVWSHHSFLLVMWLFLAASEPLSCVICPQEWSSHSSSQIMTSSLLFRNSYLLPLSCTFAVPSSVHRTPLLSRVLEPPFRQRCLPSLLFFFFSLSLLPALYVALELPQESSPNAFHISSAPSLFSNNSQAEAW